MALFPTGPKDSQDNMFEDNTSFAAPDPEPEPAPEAEFAPDFEPDFDSYVESAPELVSEPVSEPDPEPAPEPAPAPAPSLRETATSTPPDPTNDPQPQPWQPPKGGGTRHPPHHPLDEPLTIDDFAALEDRVLRAVELVRRERRARAEAEQRIAELEGELLHHSPVLEKLQQEVDALRTEREQVRHRVERLLGQLDALEL